MKALTSADVGSFNLIRQLSLGNGKLLCTVATYSPLYLNVMRKAAPMQAIIDMIPLDPRRKAQPQEQVQ